MLKKIKELFIPQQLLKGNCGIEREMLRVDKNGYLSFTDHPGIFGDKVLNPYITTDFSESQVEIITPALDKIEETYSFSKALYDIVALEIGDEILWPQSMPCFIPEDDEIPVAKYSEEGREAEEYRNKLLKKYGGKKQLISGIHYNYSFNEEIIRKLYESSDKELTYKEYKNSIYLKVTRNYLRYRWIIVYLLGAAPVIHESFLNGCSCKLKQISEDGYTLDGAVSHRNGECGYRNKEELYPNYDTVEDYVESINKYVNDGVIDSHKELYSQVRLKAKEPKNFLNSLLEDGISYLEYRSIDINPFEKGGISLNDLYFLQLLNIYMLIKEESSYDKWQQEAVRNQHLVAKYGIENVELIKDGEIIDRRSWGLEILNEMKAMNSELNLGKEDIINEAIAKMTDSSLTYAYNYKKLIEEKGYIKANVDLAEGYKESAYNNRFKLEGFEDLELSTQILMKEAIKRGIKTDIVDRSENFISLTKGEKVEYVKQATKTSKDNYVTVLIMENKTVINIFPEGTNAEDIERAFEIAFKFDKTVLIEEFIKGKEYRFLVIDDQVVGILHRVPANVLGDGVKTIRELVELKNQNPLRGKGYVTPLEKINLGENEAIFLKQQNKNFDYVPLAGETVYLRENSNISTGGDSIDYTDDIPQKFKDIAVKASKAAGAKICGVDMMLEDYSDENTNYAIIEINFNPAIHIHSYPFIGTERKIAVEVLKLLELV